MQRFEVFISRKAEQMLLSHVNFLARVSVTAARKLRQEFARLQEDLQENPYQFPVEERLDLPGEYRRALFAKRYLAIFTVEGAHVYLDAVMDCRMEPR